MIRLPSTVVSLARRAWTLLTDPPDLTERAVVVEFILAVYPDYTARVTATKLAGSSREEIQAVTNAGIAAMLTWARSQGVPLEIKAPTPKPAGPATNPLRGVRP